MSVVGLIQSKFTGVFAGWLIGLSDASYGRVETLAWPSLTRSWQKMQFHLGGGGFALIGSPVFLGVVRFT